jgi:hypothetical protein
LNEHAHTDTLLFVDAPLLVLNPDKQRLCEKQVGQRYGRWKVAANSTNLASPRLAGVRLRGELEAESWVYDDGATGSPTRGRAVSEVLPVHDDRRGARARLRHRTAALQAQAAQAPSR